MRPVPVRFWLAAALILSRHAALSDNRPHSGYLSDTRETSRRTSLECTLEKDVPASDEVIPSFVAAYPGSGSSLMRSLVPALTGLQSGNTRDVEWRGKASIKTHYPHRAGRVNIDVYLEKVKRVVLVLRNPMNSIPSYCNFQYEVNQGLRSHSTQATTEEWVRWRDERFETELQSWVEVVEYWMNNEEMIDRFVMSYEDITSDVKGPQKAFELAEFFSRSPGVRSIDAETSACLWTKVVRYDDPATVGGQTRGAKRKNKVEREYTERQMEMMKSTLKRLARKYKYKGATYLSRVLKRYVMEITVKSKVSKLNSDSRPATH